MLSYTFSRREKVLLVILALVLLALLWYMLVWQNVSSQKQAMDADIAEAEAQLVLARNKANKIGEMQDAVSSRKADGVKPSTIPHFDNTTALMAELNSVLASTTDYRLSFDELDRSSEGIVARGVTVMFGCDSIDAAREVMDKLENGPYACIIDSSTITSTAAGDNTSGNARIGVNTSRNTKAPYAVGLHAVFFESE